MSEQCVNQIGFFMGDMVSMKRFAKDDSSAAAALRNGTHVFSFELFHGSMCIIYVKK